MDDIEIFCKAASVLEKGQNIALVTLISTVGSTPGKPGYKMLVFAEGREVIGTVGGGLIEAKMIKEAKKMLIAPGKRVSRFDLASTIDDEKGICGGSVELLAETFDRKTLPLFKELSLAVDNDQVGVLLSVISPDKPPRKIFVRDIGQTDAIADAELPPELVAAVRQAVVKDQWAAKVSAGGMEVFVESVAKSPTVVIFGAGHLSGYIAKYAKSVHFQVTVYDDRREYANRARFPDADDIIVEDFRRILDKTRIDSNSHIVIVTRGHKYDQITLEQVVKTNARYIGMIGSKRKTLMILERLKHKGIPEKLLSKVYSPIGVSIGAVTPEEIALSIVCELVKIRRLGHAPKISHLTIFGSRK
jgi:xanthine dehydrogenase accessory factor